MVRWEPDTRERLREAALDLYTAKGFDETTVTEIAQAAGVTERTFFRHYADKREVLFGGSAQLQREFVEGVRAAEDGTPLDMVTSAVLAGVAYFPEERRAYSRRRQALLAANPELLERELIKMATLSAAIAAALRERGVTEPAASLAASAGVTVFRMAFEEWVAPDSARTLVEIEESLFAELRALSA
ncbi:TetR family transcriptional regulator [soil metagenome]